MNNKGLFIYRFWAYQKDRFPVFKNLLLISIFTFSAISYSRMCRGFDYFIDWRDYLLGVFMTFSLFFLLRVSDEHKDYEKDTLYRPDLPIQRGVISLRELRSMAYLIFVAQGVVLFFFHPEMTWLFLMVIGFLALMTVEFFVGKWLEKHLLLYMSLHMMIIPFIDFYASGLDWHIDQAKPHLGLLFFFFVSLFNGMVLEFGRKFRIPEDEVKGVDTYTQWYGIKKASKMWILVLSITLFIAISAMVYAKLAYYTLILFSIVYILALIPALKFMKKPSRKSANQIENMSGIWTLCMYLFLGGIPMLSSLINQIF